MGADVIPPQWLTSDLGIDTENQELLNHLHEWENRQDGTSKEARSYFLQFVERFTLQLAKIEMDMEKENFPQARNFSEANKATIYFLNDLSKNGNEDLLDECKKAVMNEIIHAYLFYHQYLDQGLVPNGQAPFNESAYF